MVTVTEQYDAYPYPARDPADERTRLVIGSPSDPVEIDHFLHAGRRDWARGFRALIAGGGTGDGLIMLAQRLADAKVPFEITYMDLSVATRRVAEARAAVRGLTSIRFETGSLLDAPDLGRFDYIDCCGVLHHLPDPAAGFRALRAALAPGGGMGVMVYAPYGRSGVYPLQEAFGALFEATSAPLLRRGGPTDRLGHGDRPGGSRSKLTAIAPVSELATVELSAAASKIACSAASGACLSRARTWARITRGGFPASSTSTSTASIVTGMLVASAA